jgi:hypothetical protein
MSKLRFVSGKEVIARVIRGLHYRLPSVYLDDLLEFVGEGLSQLSATNTLVTTSTSNINCAGELLVRNHCVSLPCGFVTVLAVEDQYGRRLPEGSDITDITNQSSVRHVFADEARPNTFNVDPYTHQTSSGVPDEAPEASVPYFGTDITADSTNTRSSHYYKIQGNYIQTSFEQGFIKLHYLTIPVDKQGYPLIPDNDAFKQALEWYVLKRLIGSGYQHPVFKYDYCEQMFEKYAGRALNEISYYTPDGAARLNRSFVRLISPPTYFQDFGIGGEQDELLRK